MLIFALLSSAFAKPPAWNLAPFGIGVYAHGKPVRGALYSVTQAAAIGALAYSSGKASDAVLAESESDFAYWQGFAVPSALLLAGSYFASVIDGSRLHELEGDAESARAAVQAWDLAVVRADGAQSLR